MKNTKKPSFESLYTKKITDNRIFWRNVPPLFTQNSSKGEKINLDDGKTIYSDKELCETFDQFFSNVVPTLNIPKQSFPMVSGNLDPIMSVIKFPDKHASIVKIKAKVLDSTFHFRKKLAAVKLKRLSVISTLKNLANKKIFPRKIIKLNKDLIAKFIPENVNFGIDEGEFPSELKHADIVPVHKKKDKSDKSNYRPVKYTT